MLKALAKDPDDRFQSARELVQAIALGAGQPSDDAAMEEIGATVVLDTADLVPPVAAVPEAPPTPVMSAAEAVAALNEVIGRSSGNVAEARAIVLTDELKNSINIDFKTRDELETLTRGFYKRGTLRDQIFGAEELYKALGMMEQNADLEQILLDIQLQQVFALYDDVSGNLYVISEAAGLGPVEELGIAAAYMSGIQEQLFSVSTLRQQASDANSDQYRAVTALQVGDVTEVAKAYISREFTLEDGAEIAKPIPGNKLLTAPAVVQAANRFPGLEGSRLISELYSTEGSWDGVNAAYQSPPVSTEQIIHPDKYFAGEEPQRTTIPNIADKLGRGWEQVGSNVMGEFLIRTYLEEELDQKQAAAAAAGWGGDRYSVLRGPQAERVFLSMTAWDDFQEADEFFEAYKTFATIKSTQAEGNSEAVGESGRKWVMKDQTIFAGQIGPVVMLVIGNTEELVSTALSLLFEALEQQETTPP